MKSHHAISVLIFLLCQVFGFGQQAVAPSARYHRLICLVHLTGSGGNENPIRPEYGTSTLDAAHGVVAWKMLLSDDKKMAILHIVATDRKAFEAILSDKRGDVKVFEIGKDKKDDIEKELRKVSKGFDLSQLEVMAR